MLIIAPLFFNRVMKGLVTPSPFIPLPLTKGKGERLSKRGFASL
jgi:hypothetical protein